MKRNIIIVLLTVCIIVALVFCKIKFFNKDFTQQIPQNAEEQLQNDNIEDIKAEPEENKKEQLKPQKTSIITKKNIKSQQKLQNKPINEIKTEKDTTEDALLEKSHKDTRSDIVNVETEYIPKKNQGQIYYRGVFYNVKIRQVLENNTQNDEKPQVMTTVSETQTIIESKPVVPKLQSAKFEKNLETQQPENSNEAIKNDSEVILNQ